MRKFRIALALSLALSMGSGTAGLAEEKGFTRNRTNLRVHAAAIAASLICFTVKGKISEEYGVFMLKKLLKEQGISDKLEWLQSDDGTKA